MAAGLATVALFALLAVVSLHYRTTLLREAQARTGRLSFILAEQAARTFEAVDFTLRGFGPLLGPPEVKLAPRYLDALLQRRVSELSFVRSLRILDLTGAVLATSDPNASDPASSQEGCIAALSSRESDPLAIGCAADGVGATGQPSIAVARRFDEPGVPARIIVADVDPGYFSQFFRDLGLGSHALVALTENRGHVLLAAADPGIGGGTGLSLPATTEPAGPARLRQLSADEITAVRATEGYPLSVLVAVSRGEVDRQWRQAVTPAFVLTVALSGLIVVLARSVEQRRTEREQSRQRALVAQKLETVGQMTASVAHDFRNILTVMGAALRLIRRHGADAQVLAEADGTIQRGNAIVDRLLAFSRRGELRPEPHRINDLLGELEVTLRHVAGTDRKLVIERGEGVPACRVDRTQFDAALMNLVVNARQATGMGAAIAVRSEAAPAGARVAVTDSGCGIDEATLRRVFEPFFTTKAEHGTGLGLAQVQAFAENSGGTVTVDSTVGLGTTVTLHLPRAAETAAAPQPLLTVGPA